MKLNNHSGLNLIIYDTTTQEEKRLTPYATKAVYFSRNIYGEEYETSADYFDIIIDDLKEVNKNHINANKRRGVCFLCHNDIYIPSVKVLKQEQQETRKEYQEGCVSVSYDDILTFSEDIKIVLKDSSYKFLKKDDPIDPWWNVNCDRLSEEIEKAKETNSYFKNEDLKKAKERLIALYQKKIDEGFDYVAFFHHSVEVVTNRIYFSNCVHHYEKTKEYKEAEKIKEVINQCCYNSHQLGMHEVLEILKKCNITIKRRKSHEKD